MATFTRFAVVAAGVIGLPITTELAVLPNTSVIVLTRSGGSTPKSLPAGVTTASVDYKDVESVTAILKENNIQVVVSTVGVEGIEAQKRLGDAAKKAGVELFVTSDYGAPTTGYTEGLLAEKKGVAEYLTSISLPSVRIYNSFFIDWIPLTVALSHNQKFNVLKGSADIGASFTSIADVSGFTAHVLTTLPLTKLKNVIFRIQGEYTTLKKIASEFKVGVEEVDEIPGEQGDIMTMLQMILKTGKSSVLWDLSEEEAETALDNKLWVGHQWQTIKDVHKLS